MNGLILRCTHNGVRYDLDTLTDISFRVDLSAVENTSIGNVFGVASQQFDLPSSQTNDKFFNAAYNINASNTRGFKNSIECQVLQNGTEIYKGNLILDEVVTDGKSNTTYKITVVNEVIDFQTLIQDQYIRDLDFELPIKELEDQLEKCQIIGQESDVDVTTTCDQINEKLIETKKKIYENLTAWQRVQLSRHPSRPYTLDHIKGLCGDTFLELHGDRNFKDDKAMVGGLGKIGGQSFMIIGQQKGYNTKTRQYRNFGMANPEGYRKALRLMKMAEKFGIPVVTLIDTPGAYPGLEAEERGQGEAIARNIYEMVLLKVPIISIIVGEGASGGALGIGVGDRVYMLENTWYSVISPESCSSILWKSWEYKEKAADALKLTSSDMKKQELVDDVIPEPLGGAHYDRETTFKTVEEYILKGYNELKDLSTADLIAQRMDKYTKMGEFKE